MIYPVNPPPKGMTWFDTWVKKRILVKPYIVWTGDVYIGCSKTGARLLKKAYRYIIKAFKSGFSWRGQINSCHFLVSTDGYCRFEISIPPFHSGDKTHLFRDFNALNIGLLKHFKHNSVSALYINHLSYFTTNPPNRVWAEPLYFERYLDFLGYQFAFAGPNARAVLTDWLATASSLMGRLDKQDFDRILWTLEFGELGICCRSILVCVIGFLLHPAIQYTMQSCSSRLRLDLASMSQPLHLYMSSPGARTYMVLKKH